MLRVTLQRQFRVLERTGGSWENRKHATVKKERGGKFQGTFVNVSNLQEEQDGLLKMTEGISADSRFKHRLIEFR